MDERLDELGWDDEEPQVWVDLQVTVFYLMNWRSQNVFTKKAPIGRSRGPPTVKDEQ